VEELLKGNQHAFSTITMMMPMMNWYWDSQVLGETPPIKKPLKAGGGGWSGVQPKTAQFSLFC